MKHLVIRVDVKLYRALMREAKHRNIHINDYVLTILQQAVGPNTEGQQQEIEYNDLDYLAGTWTQHEYEEFIQQLARQRLMSADSYK